MRILQVHNRYANAGGEDVVVELERRVLEEAGHEVLAIDAQNQIGASAAASLAVSPWNPSSARRVEMAVAEFDPHVAHVHNTWFRLTASIFGPLRRTGTPTVVTAHNYRSACLNGQLFRDGSTCTLCIGQLPLPGVIRSCYRDSLAQSAAIAVSVGIGRLNRFWSDAVDRYVAMTSFQRELLVDIGLPRDKVVVKPHFVEDTGRRTSPPSTSDTVLYVGRLAPEKGADLLLEAWGSAQPDNLKLVVVGEGPLREDLALRAPASVEFVGWETRDGLDARIRTSRAVMFPSRVYETFGLVLVETMRSATPVFAHDLGGVPEVLGANPGSPALLAHGDVAAWADRIRGLDDGSIDVDGLGDDGRRVFESRYTEAEGLRGLENLYGSVLR